MNRGPGSAKTDVLFIYTNINGFHSDVYNFGIGYLSSSLKACGFRTALSIVSTRRDYAKMVKTVLRLRPRIIGFSAVSSQFVFVSELAEIIKKVYDCVVVCGGVHPTIFPECLYSSPALDGLFIGESEASFSDFVAHVVKGSDYRKTDNFCYIDASGELVRNKLRSRVKDLETLSPPDRAIYDYQALIDKNGGMATILMSRGCPYSCTYCSNHAIAHVYGVSANTIRYNSIENGIAEISMLRLRYKFKRLWFIDDLFIMNKGWLADFLREYKRNFTIPFVCHIRPNLCTREILFQLKEAGCYRIFLAVESANEHIRNIVMRRNISIEQLENTFKWAKEARLETLSVNIIGVPGDTEETIMETINFNKRMNPTDVGVNIFSPYRGTVLGEYCFENKLIKEIDPRSFRDRRQSRLALPTISDERLTSLYKNFQFMVYGGTDPSKLRVALWYSRFEKIEKLLQDIPLVGGFLAMSLEGLYNLFKPLAKIMLARPKGIAAGNDAK